MYPHTSIGRDSTRNKSRIPRVRFLAAKMAVADNDTVLFSIDGREVRRGESDDIGILLDDTVDTV